MNFMNISEVISLGSVSTGYAYEFSRSCVRNFSAFKARVVSLRDEILASISAMWARSAAREDAVECIWG